MLVPKGTSTPCLYSSNLQTVDFKVAYRMYFRDVVLLFSHGYHLSLPDVISLALQNNRRHLPFTYTNYPSIEIEMIVEEHIVEDVSFGISLLCKASILLPFVCCGLLLLTAEY